MSNMEVNSDICIIVIFIIFLAIYCRFDRVDRMSAGELGYDSIPVIIDDTYGLPYIRNKDGKIYVPNAKHNIWDYYADHTNRCSTETDHSELQTAKKRTEKYISMSGTGAIGGVKEVPNSATEISAHIERSDL